MSAPPWTARSAGTAGRHARTCAHARSLPAFMFLPTAARRDARRVRQGCVRRQSRSYSECHVRAAAHLAARTLCRPSALRGDLLFLVAQGELSPCPPTPVLSCKASKPLALAARAPRLALRDAPHGLLAALVTGPCQTLCQGPRGSVGSGEQRPVRCRAFLGALMRAFGGQGPSTVFSDCRILCCGRAGAGALDWRVPEP